MACSFCAAGKACKWHRREAGKLTIRGDAMRERSGGFGKWPGGGA